MLDGSIESTIAVILSVTNTVIICFSRSYARITASATEDTVVISANAIEAEMAAFVNNGKTFAQHHTQAQYPRGGHGNESDAELEEPTGP